jgi:hypothetical protein
MTAASPISRAWRSGPRGLPPVWAVAAVLVVGLPNLVAAASTIHTLLVDGYAFDWTGDFMRAADRFPDKSIYEFAEPYAFRYSPIAAWLFGVVAPLGLTAWRIAHLAALAFLRDWRLIVLVLISYPFWFDVETGNLVTFVAVAGVAAFRGSRLGTGLYLALFLLVPRPLALPLAAWLLWRRPGWRVPFAAMFVAQVLIVAALGLAGPWLGALMSSTSEIHADLNLGPTALIGSWWLLIALPLATWLTWRGRLGLASLAASPYWLPYYFLMLLLELTPGRGTDTDREETPVAVLPSGSGA